MKIARSFNPLSWSRRTVIFVAFIAYAIFFFNFIYFGLKSSVSAEEIGEISIPSVSISSKIDKIALKDGRLDTPEFSVGAYSLSKNRIFLFAHSTSAFKNLEKVELEDKIIYNSENFIATKRIIVPVEEVDMEKLLRDSGEESLVLMTCYGEEKDGDYPFRLILTAVRE